MAIKGTRSTCETCRRLRSCWWKSHARTRDDESDASNADVARQENSRIREERSGNEDDEAAKQTRGMGPRSRTTSKSEYLTVAEYFLIGYSEQRPHV